MDKLEQFEAIVKEISDLFPYKQIGNRDSYNDYNQGWSDCADILSVKLKELIIKP